jgi:hypothetical protein
LTVEERDCTIERPYTSSLSLPPRWEHGHSPKPSDIISDTGDQQALQLRHKNELAEDFVAPHSSYNLEDSLDLLPASDCYDVLQARIHEAFKTTSLGQGDYLPKGQLCALINPESVAQELKQHLSDIHTSEEIKSYAETICSETQVERGGKLKIKSFRKTFA